jgi:predicted acylesterase/phospholipase RssA
VTGSDRSSNTDAAETAVRSPRQLRLALSMNGGVSLAVWIGGAVREIDDLRAGTGSWGDLLEATGHDRQAMIDVMAGASAGGLNAVLLAQSLRSGTSFEQFLPLWQQHADIDRLLQPPSLASSSQPRGVLDGDYFLRRLRDALAAADGDPDSDPGSDAKSHKRLDHDLAVLASATLVTGRSVAYADVPGAAIAETRSDAHFHVSRRGPSSRGLDGFVTEAPLLDNVDALAAIGRATSSLPGLFEPVPITRSTFGSRLVGAFAKQSHTALTTDEPVEIMDGGVIDNVPISRAIRAIATSPADHRVHRVLMYLHPDPSSAAPAGPPRTALAVVQAFRGKGKESVREDIELLRQHNDSVERRNGTATALLQGLLERAETRDAATGGDPGTLAATSARAMLLRAAIDPSSELPWHAPGVGRLIPIVDGPDDLSRDSFARRLDAVVGDPSLLLTVRIRRAVQAVQRLIRDVETAPDAPSFGDAKRRLYDVSLLADLMHAYQLARFLGHGSGDEPVGRVVASRNELAEIRVPASGPDDLTWWALASWRADEFREHGDISLTDHLDQRLGEVVASLPEMTATTRDPGHETAGDSPTESAATVASAVLRALRSGSISLDRVERALLPLAAEPVASDQQIAFVRATGDVETPASLAFAARCSERSNGAQPKVAGVQLHHLGAFFDADWRTNDWWWGRLDAVRALLDAVLDDEAIGRLRAGTWLAEHQLERSAGADTIKAKLLEQRQLELLNSRSGRSDTTLAAATGADNSSFTEWASANRRFSGLIGTRRLTSTAIRGVLTAWRTATAPMTLRRRLLLSPVRSALLAAVGILLAGRRATATLTWTICVLAAVRAGSSTGRWVTWTIGVGLAAGIGWIVERRVRPTATRSSRWSSVWLPYVIAVAGAVGGAVVIVQRDELVDRWTWWVIPVVAAVVSAWMLFFWMSRWARAAFCVLTAALYAAWAYNAFDWSAGRAESWLDWWPLRAMWVCWLVAVVMFPMLIGRLPDRWLRPQGD